MPLHLLATGCIQSQCGLSQTCSCGFSHGSQQSLWLMMVDSKLQVAPKRGSPLACTVDLAKEPGYDLHPMYQNLNYAGNPWGLRALFWSQGRAYPQGGYSSWPTLENDSCIRDTDFSRLLLILSFCKAAKFSTPYLHPAPSTLVFGIFWLKNLPPLWAFME